jgi:protein-S-isoprenylcysteine O-methyltransferase Ste14
VGSVSVGVVWRDPWDAVFLVGFVVYVAIRGVFERRTRGQRLVVRRVDGLERACLALVFVGCLLLPVLRLFTPWLGFADYRLPGFAPWLGVAALAGGLWLFWRAHADLGLEWSVVVGIREGHRLVESGVYRRVRHPMYAAILAISLGQGLLLANWLAGWAALASFTLLCAVRIPREERLLAETFGEAYAAYAGRTGRLLPRLLGGTSLKRPEPGGR